MDYNWMRDRLEDYLRIAQGRSDALAERDATAKSAADAALTELDVVVREILTRGLGIHLSAFTTYAPGGYSRDRGQIADRKADDARAALGLVQRKVELDEALRPTEPQMDAGRLHPAVWDSARSLWNTGHYDAAVEAAAKWLNAHIQQRVDSEQYSDTDLMSRVFSANGSQPIGRLHFPGPRGDTWRSRQNGLHRMAMGAYMGIRNVAVHEHPHWTQQQALERLAVFSVLASWVDECGLVPSGSEA